MQYINKRRAMAQSQSGFTLIELLVVIAILGILAAVVVFAVGGVTNDSQKSACKLELRTAKTAVQAFRAAKATYPATAADLGDGKFLEAKTAGQTSTFVLELVTITIPAPAGTPVVQGAPTYTWTGTSAGAKVDCKGITGMDDTVTGGL